MSSEIQTITQAFAMIRNRPRDQVATMHFRSGHWMNSSWGELYRDCEILAAGLKKLGLEPQQRAAILSNTRREWLIADFAIMGVGAVTVPIYQSQRAEEVQLIVNDSQATILIVEDLTQWQKWQQVASHCPTVKHVVVIDAHKNLEDATLLWDQVMDHGSNEVREQKFDYAASSGKHSPDDLATVIYTSGTTGEPKGVPLKHRQVLSEIEAVTSVITLGSQDLSLAFLPFAHVLGRIEAWASIYSGFTIAFAENTDRIRFNLIDTRPTLLIAVPRVFEKLYANIIAQAESNPALNKLFQWALKIGQEVSAFRQNKQTLPLKLSAELALADQLVFQRLRKKLGGQLRFAVSGGAPLSREIAEFFHALGILILEGYGLTETTAAITANTPLGYKFGTVGRPLPGVDVKLADDGEILVRGPQVSEAVLGKDGFFATGDIGEIDDDGFIRITDRKKDLIKTAGGKYVAPQKIENMLKMDPMISQALIHGDQEKYVVALLTLNADKLNEFAKQQEISFQDFAMLCQHPQVKGLVRGIVANVNSQLASFETIKNFAILSKDFSIEAGELTPSLKVKRKFCSEKYLDLIRSLY